MFDLKIFFIAALFAGVLGDDPKGSCADIKDGTQNLLLPDLLNLTNYVVEAQWSNGKEGRMLQEFSRKDPSITAVKSQDKANVDFQWIFDGKNTTFSKGGICKIVPALGEADEKPLGFKNLKLEDFKLGKDVNTIKDLITKLQGVKLDKSGVMSGKFHDHEVGPVVHWIGCVNNTANDKVLQITVCYPDQTSPFVTPDGAFKKFPVKVELAIPSASGTNEVEYTLEFFNGVSTPSAEQTQEFTMIPPSIYCNGSKTEELPMKTNLSFSVGIHYRTEGKSGCHDSVRLMADSEHRIVAYTFTRNKDNDDYFAQKGENKGLKNNTRYTVVHDFFYGLEYVMEEPDKKCAVAVRPIPTDSGDIKPAGDENRTVGVLDAPHLLFRNPETPEPYQFTKLGQVSQAGGNLLTVYNAKWVRDQKTPNNNFFVVEAAFEGNATPVSLITHHHDADGVFTTSQSFEDFQTFAAGLFPYESISISPCMTFSNQSFLYMTLNVGMKKLEETGTGKVQNVLRKWIAEKAGVSILRVGQFYLKETEKNLTLVFFTIAEKSSVVGTEVVDMKMEINATAAAAALNSTLNATVTIEELKVSVVSSSLRSIPKDFHPTTGGGVIPPAQIVNKGYSSGSMAVLAICMMLIGGAMGMVVAFFMWKRNRGIAYQAYE